MADQTLLKGIRLFQPKPSQPDFVLASGVITLNELVTFAKENPQLLSEYNGEKQLRIQLLKSKDGKPYMVVDTWKPAETTAPAFAAPTLATKEDLDQLPF
jgi:DNA-binding GntR family transcriptional regulator